MNKRFISGLAALALAAAGAAGVPAGTDGQGFDTAVIASAEARPTGGTCGDDLTWTFDSEGTLTIKGSGKMYDYTDSGSPWGGDLWANDGDGDILKVIIGDGVTSIGDVAFGACYFIKDVSIPDSVTSIGERAFINCAGISNIKIPSGVTSIGEKAFFCCSSITNLTIPDGVTNIGTQTFIFCESLTDMTIPGSVKSVGKAAFRHCKALTNVTISEGVETIENYCFCNCPNIKSISFPKTIKTIGTCAFGYATESSKVENFTVYGYTGTAAETYAKDNGFTFVSLGEVSTATPGDIDGKDGVTESDVALLQQYLADWKVTIDEKAADVNCDGKVNEADVALMQQYLADWKVTLGAKA